MTKDQFDAWATQSGLDLCPGWVMSGKARENLEAFAKLAEAHEREQCAIEASSWKRSKLLLHAGELTAQERRSCEAVSTGIAAAIRSRITP